MLNYSSELEKLSEGSGSRSESAILNEDFRKKWIEKEIGRYKHVELLE